MSAPQILIVANDPILSTIYGEGLAAAGFHAVVATTGEEALRLLPNEQIRAVALDLALPTMSAAEVVDRLRAEKSTRLLPIIGLPTDIEPLARNATKAGLTRRLKRFANPVATLIQAILGAVTFDDESIATGTQPPQPVRLPHGALEHRLAQLRHSLPSATAAAPSPTRFSQLLQDIHQFTELAALSTRAPLFQMAGATESLIFDLHRQTAAVTPSCIRTIGQAIDLLATLIAADAAAPDTPSATQVLVVDDDANARQLIMAALSLVNLTSAPAATPASALEILTQTSFELIFLDIGMPKMNGFELCTKIRALPLHAKTPIVFLTGSSSFENRVQSSLRGGNDFVGKPFSLAELGLKALLWIGKSRVLAA